MADARLPLGPGQFRQEASPPRPLLPLLRRSLVSIQRRRAFLDPGAVIPPGGVTRVAFGQPDGDRPPLFVVPGRTVKKAEKLRLKRIGV
jgi:hypothetical protein